MSNNRKVWFITGASSGFGRAFATAAMERGDNVAGSAQQSESLRPLQEHFKDNFFPVRLDVTNRDEVFAAAARVREHFGRIDVLFSNAGYGHFGTIEGFPEDEFRRQMEINFFGSLNVIQAVLPGLREQRSGHILQTTSIGGVVSFPLGGAYHASKWALEGMCDTLAQEVAGFGVKITIVEPGSFATNFIASSQQVQTSIPDYDQTIKHFTNMAANTVFEDPQNAAKTILQVVDSLNPPLRLLLGAGSNDLVKATYEDRLKVWAKWPN